jgi:LTXXQ motif family protein
MAKIGLQARVLVWSLVAALALPAAGEARRRHHGHHGGRHHALRMAPDLFPRPETNAPMDRAVGRPARRDVGWLPALAGVARMCREQAHELTDWSIERIGQTVQPSPSQRGALDAYRRSASEAFDALRADCPADAARTPTERLDQMSRALEVMLRAVNIVRPALESFYGSLDDEQKAQLNAMVGPQGGAAPETRPKFGQLCDGLSAADFGEWRLDRVEEAIRPSQEQRQALERLRSVSIEGGKMLQASCSGAKSLTPTRRLETMSKQVEAALRAVDAVRPALVDFYNRLDDRQKARLERTAEAR